MNIKSFSPITIPGLLIMTWISGCAPIPPPDHVENLCQIFQQYPEWYWSAQSVQAEWGLPMPVLMSIIYQESGFHAEAKPPREKLLWIIPWFRPTSAYGYSQAVKETWCQYKKDLHHRFVSRDAFEDAADFVGWYSDQIHRKTAIPKGDARKIYLAYHEGIGGYQRGTYQNKSWLITTANRVQVRANTYGYQLKKCQKQLPKKPFWHIWS